MNLAGRSAIITGANQGLGRAIATSFVRSGASVLLVARTTVRPASCHLRTTALWSCVAGRPPQSRPAEIYVWLFAPLLLKRSIGTLWNKPPF